MTEGQLLLLFFGALYLFDCIRWLPPSGHYFRRWWGKRWRWKKQQTAVTIRGLRPVFVNPLPTLGSFLAADDWPAIPHPKGLVIPGDGGALSKAIPWEELTLRRDPGSKRLRILPKRHLYFSSVASAKFWQDLLAEMKATEGQADLESRFAPTFSIAQARAVPRRFDLVADCTRSWGLQLFVLCFVALPMVIWRWGDHPVTYGAVALMLLVLLFTAIAYFRAASSRALPSLRESRWSSTFLIGSVPFHAMRAHDLLGTESAESIHPIALGAATLNDQDFSQLASQLWRRWRFCEGGERHAGILLKGIKNVAATRDLTIADMEAPPERDSSSAAYCPRCHVGYVETGNTCRDCGKIPTISF